MGWLERCAPCPPGIPPTPAARPAPLQEFIAREKKKQAEREAEKAAKAAAKAEAAEPAQAAPTESTA